jgi:MFS family permease
MDVSLTAPQWGRAADEFGRRPTALLSMLLMSGLSLFRPVVFFGCTSYDDDNDNNNDPLVCMSA